jgi:hypothetical protein
MFARLIIWVLVSTLFPLSVTGTILSFKLEVIRGTTSLALPAERSMTLTERVLAYLEVAERTEREAWFQTDYRIAWLTTRWANYGVPEWSWHKQSSPYVAATFQVLHCHPDQVWPRILELRRVNLGPEYSRFYHDSEPLPAPKKPCAGTKTERRKEAA